MYFPYLFDKQSELLALRELAGSLGKPQMIVPIIEPVNTAGGLKRLHAAFKASGDYAYVIENPNLLDLAVPAINARWQTDAAPLIADKDVIRPVLKETPATTVADIGDFVSRHAGRSIGIVVNSGRIPVADLSAALGKTTSLVFMTNGADRVALAAALGTARLVEVNSRFPSQRVNADYSGNEWFSRDHLDFATTGYAGFSDYTVLESKPAKKGGGAPGAVAIHLAFKQTDDTLWIEHFVSDETDQNVGNVASKLLEAIAYIEAQVTAAPTKFESSPALTEYLRLYSGSASSSLGNNKKLEIAHHLFTVGKRLGI